jgi:hypothetical protein
METINAAVIPIWHDVARTHLLHRCAVIERRGITNKYILILATERGFAAQDEAGNIFRCILHDIAFIIMIVSKIFSKLMLEQKNSYLEIANNY